MALRNGMISSTPLNGCEIKCTVLLCLIYKNSYVPRPVQIHFFYVSEMFVSGASSMRYVIMQYLNYFLS